MSGVFIYIKFRFAIEWVSEREQDGRIKVQWELKKKVFSLYLIIYYFDFGDFVRAEYVHCPHDTKIKTIT